MTDHNIQVTPEELLGLMSDLEAMQADRDKWMDACKSASNAYEIERSARERLEREFVEYASKTGQVIGTLQAALIRIRSMSGKHPAPAGIAHDALFELSELDASTTAPAPQHSEGESRNPNDAED